MVILENSHTGVRLAKLNGLAWEALNDQGRGLLLMVEEVPGPKGELLGPGDDGYLSALRASLKRSSCYRLVSAEEIG